MNGAVLLRLFPSVLLVLVLLVVWQVAVDALHVSVITLPSPSAIWSYMVATWGSLWTDTLVTARECVVGLAISTLVGVPLGILTHYSNIFRITVYPLLVASQAFPKVAVGPLFIIWFGFGQLPIILLAVILAFFPVTLNTMLGLSAVTSESRELSRMIGLRSMTAFRKVMLPQALPSIFAGLRLASVLVVVGVVVGEFLGTSEGLGYRVASATASANTPSLFSALVLLSLLGVVLYVVVTFIEYASIPWYREA